MKKYLIATAFLCLLAVLNACKDPLEVDRSIPVVESATVNGSATFVMAVPGDTLFFDLTFSDDQELQKYRIQVIEDFIAPANVAPFDTSVVETLAATTEVTTNAQLVIPNDVDAGDFQIQIEVLDHTGNLSDPMVIDMNIAVVGQPSINVTVPNLGVDLVANIGDTLLTSGTISDDEALAQVDVRIFQNTSTGPNTLYLSTYTYQPADLVTVWSLDTLELDSVPLNIPTTSSAGTYELVISAFDTLGNYSAGKANVIVNQ